MSEWKYEVKRTLVEAVIEAVGKEIRRGTAEVDIEYSEAEGVVSVTLRREPFRAPDAKRNDV